MQVSETIKIANCAMFDQKKKKKEELNQDQVSTTPQYGRRGKKGKNILFVKLNEINYVRLKIDVLLFETI